MFVPCVQRAENIVHVVFGHGLQEVAYLLLSLEGTHPSRYYRIICNTDYRDTSPYLTYLQLGGIFEGSSSTHTQAQERFCLKVNKLGQTCARGRLLSTWTFWCFWLFLFPFPGFLDWRRCGSLAGKLVKTLFCTARSHNTRHLCPVICRVFWVERHGPG